MNHCFYSIANPILLFTYNRCENDNYAKNFNCPSVHSYRLDSIKFSIERLIRAHLRMRV